MSDSISKASIIFEIEAIWDSDNQITTPQIHDEIKALSKDGYSKTSMDDKIILARMEKIQNQYEDISEIIIYSKTQRKLLEDLKEKLDKNPQFPNVRTIFDEQTLFYYIGKMSSKILGKKLILIMMKMQLTLDDRVYKMKMRKILLWLTSLKNTKASWWGKNFQKSKSIIVVLYPMKRKIKKIFLKLISNTKIFTIKFCSVKLPTIKILPN